MGEFRGFNPTIPDVLPHEKMYNLQIGDKLFVLSGASLSSDAPSYFTNYFLERTEDKPLFIDRSPQSFQYIYNHLQGYHSEIPNGDIFTKVYSDSIYYNLPRLKELLSKDEYYYVEVMNECIKVPKAVLRSEGNFPNFFNITFEALYRDLSELMISRKLIRPPPQAAPQLNRDAGLLKDLIKLLQGVELKMTNDYKKVLRKEARYYRFNALVEKLSYVKIIKNPITLEESIIVNYNDVAYKNFTIVDIDTNDGEPILKRPRLDHVSDNQHYTRSIKYERRYLDKGESRGLIVEIDTPEIIADLDQEISSSSTNNLIKKIHLSTKITSFLSRCFNHFNNITGYEFGNQSTFNIYQGQIILDNIKLEHQQDCQGNLRFNDADFSFNDKKSSLSLDSFNDYEQLLFKKSYWKLDIGINDGEQKFYVNFTPVKVEAVANTKASMYSCLI